MYFSFVLFDGINTINVFSAYTGHKAHHFQSTSSSFQYNQYVLSDI